MMHDRIWHFWDLLKQRHEFPLSVREPTYSETVRAADFDPTEAPLLSNPFDKCQISVAPRVVRDMTDHFKTELLVKAGSLEIVSFDHDLPAISSFRFLLHGTHQHGAASLISHACRNKKIPDVAGASPGPAKRASLDGPIGGSQKRPR
jgi:hypothetical protein